MRKLFSYAAVAMLAAAPAARAAGVCIFDGYLPCTPGSSVQCDLWKSTGLYGKYTVTHNLDPATCQSDVVASRQITKTIGYCQAADGNPLECPQPP